MSVGRRWLALLALVVAPAAVASGPDRICSVSLAGDELLALLVPPERVVCVTPLVDDPATSNVAGHYPPRIARVTARIEPVLATRPDLVLAAPWNDPDFLRLLERVGVPARVLASPGDFTGIRQLVRTLGDALGVPGRAAAVVADMDRRLAAVDRRLDGIDARPRVLSFAQLVAAGQGTTIAALIGRAGGRNAAAELGLEGHRKIGLEAVLALDPDVLLVALDDRTSLEQWLTRWPALRQSRAVREGAVVAMPARWLTTVTPHLVDGVERLAQALHPERFPDRGP